MQAFDTAYWQAPAHVFKEVTLAGKGNIYRPRDSIAGTMSPNAAVSVSIALYLSSVAPHSKTVFRSAKTGKQDIERGIRKDQYPVAGPRTTSISSLPP
jgi:hypothetical protein